MRRIAELVDQSLTWEQPQALKMEYDLRSGGGELAATLRFRRFGTFATAESADGCWTFKRVGFWRTKVTVRPCGSDAEIAVFNNNTWSGGGTLEISGDSRMFKATTSFWRTKFRFESEAGETLVEFKNGGFLHLSLGVEIQPTAVRMPDLSLMAMLGCYLFVMMAADATASTVVGTAG